MSTRDIGGMEDGAATPSVVVIDDDRAGGEIIGRFIAGSGFTVRVESNVFAGLHAVRRAQPTVVLLDIQLPGIDGIEAAAMVHRYAPAAKVILMSGFPEQLSKASRDSLAAFAILEKPLPLPAIVDFVRRAVG
ncbi:response regulator [Minwuia thermotolerans]|uniref:Response regulatory domain-containing protein n=1 Tax=Minwuia thermotolerans TaxID=2056226 RepID=A0A2M9G1A7_9PROT|nr:response regulator [Minwuia thermotolerans]PJK29507.1 hypothetical protein CVT23_10620 [Minwuia thermotolerans]